jgi:taurine dioxygenase
MSLQFVPLGPALGAEVRGLDVRRITAEQSRELYDGWLRHHELVVHGEPVTEDELVEFGKCFGPIERARKPSPLASRPEIMVISNIRQDGQLVGSLPDGELSFHFDRIHQKVPNKAGVLMALEIPSKGGDTLFSNMCMAYDTLPDKLRSRLGGLTALNTYEYGRTQASDKNLSAQTPSAVHPVVRRIPETGRHALYVCRLMTDRINALDEDESRELLAALCDHVENPAFTYAHRWRAGDIVIWDNRCTVHARTDFDASERRLLKRVTVGDTVGVLA